MFTDIGKVGLGLCRTQCMRAHTLHTHVRDRVDVMAWYLCTHVCTWAPGEQICVHPDVHVHVWKIKLGVGVDMQTHTYALHMWTHEYEQGRHR